MLLLWVRLVCCHLASFAQTRMRVFLCDCMDLHSSVPHSSCVGCESLMGTSWWSQHCGSQNETKKKYRRCVWTEVERSEEVGKGWGRADGVPTHLLFSHGWFFAFSDIWMLLLHRMMSAD